MADSLRVFESLKSSLTESQARAVTFAIQQSETELALDIKTVLEEHRSEWRRETADFKQEIRQELKAFATRDELKAQLAELKAELMRWMFLFWIGQVAVTAGLVLTVVRILK